MAEHESGVEGETLLESLKSYAGSVLRSFSQNDGTLAAAFRQGADEIGEALKAFPDSIQTHEPGTILSPTQGEIADARDPERSSLQSANENRVYDPREHESQEMDQSRGR